MFSLILTRPKLMLCAAFYFFISNASIAQQFHSSTSEVMKDVPLFNLRIKLAGNYYNLQLDYRIINNDVEAYFTQTDAETNRKLNESAKKLKIEDLVDIHLEYFGGSLYIIYQQILKHGAISNVMASKIDTSTLELGQPKVIVDIESAGYKAKVQDEHLHDYKFFLSVSADKSKMMVLLSHEKTASQFFVAMMDNKLNVLWQKTELLDLSDNNLSVRDACTDNDGIAFMAYRIFEGNKNKLPPSGLNHILVVSKNKKKDVTIDMGDVYTKSITLLPSKVNNSIHFGNYYYTSDFLVLNGVYSGSISSADMRITNFKKTAFPQTLITEVVKDGWGFKKGSNTGINSNLSARLLELDNGNLDIIAEFSTRQFSGKNEYMLSGSIINAYMGSTETYFSRIPKYRVSTIHSAGDSFSAFPFDDKIVVFYNDNDDNLKKPITESAGSSNVYKNVVMVGAVLQPGIAINRTIVIDQQKENYLAFTDKIENIDKNTFWVPLYRIKGLGGITDDFKLGKVWLK